MNQTSMFFEQSIVDAELAAIQAKADAKAKARADREEARPKEEREKASRRPIGPSERERVSHWVRVRCRTGFSLSASIGERVRERCRKLSTINHQLQASPPVTTAYP
jgi:chemotaxis protein histidine kinase CheA